MSLNKKCKEKRIDMHMDHQQYTSGAINVSYTMEMTGLRFSN